MELAKLQLQIDDYKDKPFTLYITGDTHIGAANHAKASFKKAVATIATDGHYWLDLGDKIDAINHLDKRFDTDEIDAEYTVRDLKDLPRKQCDEYIYAVSNIADKCVGLISGNHEDKYMSRNTFDSTSYIANAIGAPNLQQKAWIILNFQSGNKSFPIKLVACHGTGGSGKMAGTSINRCVDLFTYDLADVKVCGHSHMMQTARFENHTYSQGILRKEYCWYGVSGCYLYKQSVGNRGYFEQRPGAESTIGMLKLTIVPNARSRDLFKINLEKIFI